MLSRTARLLSLLRVTTPSLLPSSSANSISNASGVFRPPTRQEEKQRQRALRPLEETLRARTPALLPTEGHLAGRAARIVRKYIAKAVRAERNDRNSRNEPFSSADYDAIRAAVEHHYTLTYEALGSGLYGGPVSSAGVSLDGAAVAGLAAYIGVRYDILRIPSQPQSAQIATPSARELAAVLLLERRRRETRCPQAPPLTPEELDMLWGAYALPYLRRALGTEASASVPLRWLLEYLPVGTDGRTAECVSEFLAQRVGSTGWGDAGGDLTLAMEASTTITVCNPLLQPTNAEENGKEEEAAVVATEAPLIATGTPAEREREEEDSYEARLRECHVKLSEGNTGPLYNLAHATVRAVFRELHPRIGDQQPSGVPLELLERRSRWDAYYPLLGPLASFVQFYDGLFFGVYTGSSGGAGVSGVMPYSRVSMYKGTVGPWLLYGRLLARLFPPSVPLPLLFVAESLSWAQYFSGCGALPSVYASARRRVVRGTLLAAEADEKGVPAEAADGVLLQLLEGGMTEEGVMMECARRGLAPLSTRELKQRFPLQWGADSSAAWAELGAWVECCVRPLLRSYAEVTVPGLEARMGPWWRDSLVLWNAPPASPHTALAGLLWAYTRAEEPGVRHGPCLTLRATSGSLYVRGTGHGAPEQLLKLRGLRFEEGVLRPSLPPVSLAEWVAEATELQASGGEASVLSQEPVEAWLLEGRDILVWDSGH